MIGRKSTVSNVFRTGSYGATVEKYFNLVINNKVDIANYIKRGSRRRNFNLIDTNRFTSYVFAETGIKPTTIGRALRRLKAEKEN